MELDGRRWVEIEWVILPVDHRSDNLPADTRELPYVGRARGLASGSAASGEQVEVVTLAGRALSGALVDVSPGYSHSFGRPLDAWVVMRESIRTLVTRGPA